MKNVGKYACMTALAGALVACDPGITIEGRWVEPIPGMKGVQGFELKKGGEASSINMATLRYKSWEQSGQSLILSGKSIGNGVSASFSDTLTIERVTADSLVLKRGDLSLIYSRPAE